jgi:hypothetical protein
MSASICIVFLLGAGAYDDLFTTAATAYNTGDYVSAVRMYEQLITESVVRPEVFYNLGNAYYRSGRIGPAIANYERALQLNPRMENARENLEKAVRDTQRRLARPLPPEWEQSLLFWHYRLSYQTTYMAAMVVWFALWILLGIRLWRPGRYTRSLAIAVAVLAVGFGASAWAKAHPVMLAVADAERVPVHYGTNENETVRFELYAGDRVTVDKRMDGWARVTTVDGERGWAQDRDLVFVGPPYERPDEVQPPVRATGAAST